jgi:hypothetical protein
MEPQPNPAEKKSPTWPILVNLAILVMSVMVLGTEGIVGTVIGLVVINVIAAVILGISKGRMHYVLAFILACMVILLIGLGMCALAIMGN